VLDPAGERYLAEIARRLRARLGGELVAGYLTGSGAYGGWVADRSDIDVIAICARPLTAAAKRDLVEALRHRALPCPARGLELVVYDRAAVTAPGHGVGFQVNLNTGPAIEERATFDPGDEPGHWFVIDLSIARERARALVGPPPARLIGPIARADVLAALGDSLDWHDRNEGASANAVLGACRAWRYAVEGGWSSKEEAGRWALGRAGDPAAIEQALALRAGAEGALDPGGVEAVVGEARRAIGTATAEAATA
jgi:Aminoglycoside adenylyltransferase, C-terminal domain